MLSAAVTQQRIGRLLAVGAAYLTKLISVGTSFMQSTACSANPSPRESLAPPGLGHNSTNRRT